MEENKLYSKVGNGALRATVMTVILLAILAVIMNFADVGNKFFSVYYVVVTCLSIIYGAIFAARKINKKGWLVGILVAVIYMIILYIIGAVFFHNFSFDSKVIYRFTLAVFVGGLSGMLGINI